MYIRSTLSEFGNNEENGSIYVIDKFNADEHIYLAFFILKELHHYLENFFKNDLSQFRLKFEELDQDSQEIILSQKVDLIEIDQSKMQPISQLIINKPANIWGHLRGRNK